MAELKTSPDLLIFLLASVSSWPQPPGIVVNHIGEDDLLGLHIDAKLDLESRKTNSVQ